jgi:hypothetical protein
MITQSSAAALVDAQTPSGAFRSFVQRPTLCIPDENAFATALVMEALSSWPGSSVQKVRAAAIAFLLRCQRPGRPGAFAFYPADAHPDWFPGTLPADADDTALATLVLHRQGFWSIADLRRVASDVLLPYRVRRAGCPTWLRPGGFPTWLDAARRCNPIDICVNLNVATLLHVSERHQSECDRIIDMIGEALLWAGNCTKRQATLSPFYRNTKEMEVAIARAVNAGVRGAERLRAVAPICPLSAVVCSQCSICCSVDGEVSWYCPVLWRVRLGLASSCQQVVVACL